MLTMAVAVFAVKAMRLGMAIGRDSGTPHILLRRQVLAPLVIEKSHHPPEAATLLPVTNDWQEVQSLLSNYPKAAYALGRKHLLENPNEDGVEVWIPLRPEQENHRLGPRIVSLTSGGVAQTSAGDAQRIWHIPASNHTRGMPQVLAVTNSWCSITQ